MAAMDENKREATEPTPLLVAVRSLVTRFTGELSGPRQATRKQMVNHLANELDVSGGKAHELFDRLRDSGVVTRGDEAASDEAGIPEQNSQRWEIHTDGQQEERISELSREIIDVPAVGDDSRQSVDLLRRAIAARATDIHLEPFCEEVEVRYRIDGHLQHFCRLSEDVATQIIGQFKLMAELDITEPFTPQEGRLELPSGFADYDVRITVTPVLGGDAVALRVLHRNHLLRPLESLGLSEDRIDQFRSLLHFNEGLVLVTGPSGSGKTTTLYSLVHALDNGHRSIVTIEDPVEYRLPGFAQIEVDRRHKVTMSSGLRTTLRMDPDIVLLGEIRDGETAQAAMRAASSGKYVFSTFHTRDVASVVTGLRDLNVDSRSLAGNLRAIVSQRLVRRLCQKCREPRAVEPQERELFEVHNVDCPDHVFEAVGCDVCHMSGFHGRVGVFEIAACEDAMSTAIEDGASELELRQLLRRHGIPSLSSDALQKVASGLTGINEVDKMSWVELRSSEFGTVEGATC